MTERKTAAEILGHQAGCANSQRDPETHGCVCAFPLPILVAAIKGTLRREHDHKSKCWPDLGLCPRCGKERRSLGPCQPPLDGALAWEMTSEIVGILKRRTLYVGVVFDAIREGINAIARLYVKLHDEGLLP